MEFRLSGPGFVIFGEWGEQQWWWLLCTTQSKYQYGHWRLWWQLWEWRYIPSLDRRSSSLEITWVTYKSVTYYRIQRFQPRGVDRFASWYWTWQQLLYEKVGWWWATPTAIAFHLPCGTESVSGYSWKSTPSDYLNCFICKQDYETIVDETNRYVQQVRNREPCGSDFPDKIAVPHGKRLRPSCKCVCCAGAGKLKNRSRETKAKKLRNGQESTYQCIKCEV